MNKKCFITGDTSGIGKVFRDYFYSKGWIVVGFNRHTGIENVIKDSFGCNLFINNAYLDGKQIEYLNKLHQWVDKMIVCGSVAAFNPDPALPEYSQHKKELAARVKELNKSNILMLHLSAKGYNDSEGLIKIVDTWLDHPSFVEVMFDPTGLPNG